jgi:cobaltochelatase CobS
MLVGPAGAGKSHAVSDAAKGLGLGFASIVLTQQTPVSQLAGFIDATGTYRRTAFREAVEFGGVFFVDEIDHGHANTVGFINGATANGSVGFPDQEVRVHEDFRLIAAANTFGRGQNRLHTGATQLDGATLNRMAVIEFEYDEAIENAMVAGSGATPADQARVLEFVRRVRGNALRHPEFKLIASPRNSVRIASGLANGAGWDEAVEVGLWAGLEADKRAKLV